MQQVISIGDRLRQFRSERGLGPRDGWITKIGGWRITDSGLQALETYPDEEELLRAIHRLRHPTTCWHRSASSLPG
jgi:hypothetical protein